MNRFTLNNAIYIAHFLMLANKVLARNKSETAALSRARAFLEHHVVYAIFGRVRHESYDVIANMANRVNYDLNRMNLLFNVPKMIESYIRNKEHISFSYAIHNKDTENKIALMFGSHELLIDDMISRYTSNLKITGVPNLSGSAEEQRKALHVFSSLVRNGNWTPVLNAMGLPVHDVLRYQPQLKYKHGSNPGDQEFEGKFQSLLTVKDNENLFKTVTRKESGKCIFNPNHFSVFAQFGPEAIFGNPSISDLINEHNDYAISNIPSVASVVEPFMKPVEIRNGQDIDEVMELRFDLMCEALKDRRDTVEIAINKHREEKVNAQKKKTLEKLRELGPLLKVLKDHPELIEKALE